MSTFTPNLQLEEVARGGDLGTWDTPTNANWSIMDSCIGNITTIGLNNSNVLLSATQYQSKTITFNSTLTASVVITFPTSFTKSYEIQNLCTGTSAFTITMTTTAAGGQAICAPPGENVDIINDSVSLKYRNLDRIGVYVDFAATSVPGWISGCTVPPYLNCNGTTFSSATYPQLATILGSTTVPDSRGRTRYAADAGTGRISAVIANPNTVGSGGGDQNLQAHAHSGSGTTTGQSADHSHVYQQAQYAAITGGGAFNSAAFNAGANTGGTSNDHTHGYSFTTANAGSGSAQNMPPLFIHGITMIRAG